MTANSHEVLNGPLRITMARDGDRRTIHLEGELDLSTAEPVQAHLQEALADASCNLVVLDMERLEFIDSSGIALLLQAIGRDGDGERLRLVPSRHVGVAKLLEMTGLDERLTLLRRGEA